MKFKLSVVKDFYMTEEIPIYQKLGFEFKPYTDPFGLGTFVGMQKYDYVCTNQRDEVEIEIANLDGLLKFIKKYGKIVVDKGSITIYNDYIE